MLLKLSIGAGGAESHVDTILVGFGKPTNA